jgi:alkylation response protein AidB-like acyl-CoA dehydrogenase
MATDDGLLALVRKSARGFTERYSDLFDQVEARSEPEFPSALLKEAAELGWLTALTDTTDPDLGTDEAELLAALVYEVSRCSPAFGARLLAHHFCRACVGGRDFPDATRDPVWFGLDATTGDERFAPTLALVDAAGSAVLSGSMRLVIGGGSASRWLGAVRLGDDRRGLVLIDRTTASSMAPVATLGLRGLNAVEATFVTVSATGYRLIAAGSAVPPLIHRAYRSIGHGTLGLTLAQLEQTQRIATNHAQTRRQNGSILCEIPAVRQLLTAIERALSLVRLTYGAYFNHAEDAEALLGEVRAAAASATDAGLQVLGGAGYIVGNGMERLWRDARQVGQLYLRDRW